jgi:hypothetical protein
MNDFISEIQCDELDYQPTAADWAEYQDWLDSQPERDEDFYVPEDFEECEEDPIDLYGGDDSHYWQYDE